MTIPLPITDQSAWNVEQIESFLNTQNTPMRVAVIDIDAFPMICSVWHHYHDQKIYAVAHKNSKLVRKLTTTPQCAFEIAPNEPPYKGVRGQAIAAITTENSDDTLTLLANKFLGDGYNELRNFLSSRSKDERVIKLQLNKITAWDFSQRMSQ